MMNGILPIDKPAGFTSHDVVAKLRGILKMKKIGHAGTLDPMATGVLPLFLGPATKACDRQPNHDKAYTATIRLGITTDTQDITGTVIQERPVEVSPHQVEQALKRFSGEIWQIPPMFSAVQIGGKRLYELARQGKTIDRPARKITVYQLDLLGQQGLDYEVHISCSKGTYVRTIAHDLGEALGCGATLAALRRTNSSGFTLEDCLTIEQVEERVKEGTLAQRLIPVEHVFMEYQPVELTQKQMEHFFNGVPLWLRPLGIEAEDQWLRIYGSDQTFLGVARANKEKMQLSEQKRFAGEGIH